MRLHAQNIGRHIGLQFGSHKIAYQWNCSTSEHRTTTKVSPFYVCVFVGACVCACVRSHLHTRSSNINVYCVCICVLCDQTCIVCAPLGAVMWHRVLICCALLALYSAAPPAHINRLALFPDKSAWCEAKNITQIVGHTGCQPRSIQNRSEVIYTKYVIIWFTCP